MRLDCIEHSEKASRLSISAVILRSSYWASSASIQAELGPIVFVFGDSNGPKCWR
jgi:hypothetical protein